MDESYITLAGPGRAELTEKKSRFIGYAAPCADEGAALAFLAAVKGEHPAASHHVYAYRLRAGARARYSDDGEPQKTAGLPVLEKIDALSATDCAVVVVRYFGGTLLGTGGLRRAYGAGAEAALAAAGTARVTACVTLSLTVPYALQGPVRRALEEAGAAEITETFGAMVEVGCVFPAPRADEITALLRNVTRGLEAKAGPVFYRALAAK